MDREFYLVAAAIALSLIPGSSTVPTEYEVGATQEKRLELFTPPNDSFIVHPFECEVKGLSKDEIDDIIAGSSSNMLITLIDGSNNGTYTIEKDNGEQIYNLELKAVSNTLFVKGEALLNNSDQTANGSSLDGTKCEVVFRDAEEGPKAPEILSTYNHVVLMNGAPEQVISCAARGYPRPHIRWFSYDPNVDARVLLGQNRRHDKPGETTSYLLFSQVTNQTSGNYTCLVENAHGRVQKTFEVEVISVEAINPHCNDLDDLATPRGQELFAQEDPFNIQEILRRSKRHLWYQWRGQKIYIPPFNRPFDPPNKKRTESDLQKMINNMVERLLLADKVAVNKWDNGTPVEDAPRERTILDNMVHQAQQQGLDPSWARQYFRDQIEANKDIQYELISLWDLQGSRPPGPPVDLGNEIRPQIDAINNKLMRLAKATEFQRRSPNCSGEVEKSARFAVFLYNLDPLHQRALQKAAQNVCIFPVGSPGSPNDDFPDYRFYPAPPPGPIPSPPPPRGPF